MAKVWARILKTEGIIPDDSFFALGGDSLCVIKVQAAILQYGWTIRTQDFYDFQTLRGICARINSKQFRKAKTSVRLNQEPVPEYAHLGQAKLKNVRNNFV